MSHSGYSPDAEREREEMEKVVKKMHQGFEGEFPEGRLRPDDQGAVAVGIGHQDGKVMMQFPKAVNWIGFTPEQAIEIAETLIDHARSCGCKRPLTLTIGAR